MTPKNIYKIFIPKKILFFLKTPKNIERKLINKTSAFQLFIFYIYILELSVLMHISTILSLMNYTCKDVLYCTVYVTNGHIADAINFLY